MNADGGSRKKELALFVEDDLIVSKFAYRWLRAVDNAYGYRSDYGGASIQTDELLTQPEAGKRYPLFGPKQDTTFMYKAVSPWGFSPQPGIWRDFQVRLIVSFIVLMTRCMLI